MTIWVGHDGTLNDDEGDGPAIAGNPIEALAASLEDEEFFYDDAYGGEEVFVGADFDMSSLSSLGSSIGSAFGQGGGGGGSGGAGSMDFGKLAGSLGGALGGALGGKDGSSAGSTIGDIFGSAIQGAESGGAGGAFGNIAASFVDKVVTPAIQSTAQPHPSGAGGTSTPTTPAALPPSHPAHVEKGTAQGRPAGARRGDGHTIDPKAALLVSLGRMAKKYGMPPPVAVKASATKTGWRW